MAPKPLTLAFSTFLKITTKKPRGKIGEIRRFTQAGGYDFYKKMKQIASQLSMKQITLVQAKAMIEDITKAPERVHTLAAIEKLDGVLKSWDLIGCEPPDGSYKSASGLLTIKLRPDLALKKSDGTVACVYLWNLAKPDLNEPLAGEGLWLSRQKIGGVQNAFGILDLRTSSMFNEKSISLSSGLRAKLDLMLIEEIWKDIHNPALTADETVAHVSSLLASPPP